MGRLRFQEEIVGGDQNALCFSRVSVVRPRRSFHRSSSSLALVNSRKSFSYDKLAQVPIQLTVVKLDGSSFGISVTKSATITDLKQAVERVFSHLSTQGYDEISWRHVWGQFCLSYDRMKLLNDSEYIKDCGIRDGDELRFVRHDSIAYNLIKRRSRKRLDVLRSCTVPETSEEVRQSIEEDEDDLKSLKYQRYKHETISCGSIQTVQHESPAIQRSRQSHWRKGGFIGYFRSLFHSCDKSGPSCSSKVSQVEI